MRVITGSARGRRLKTLEGNDVRPTTDRVKESVFSIIQFDVAGAAFLDLFAGSGQMGIEALSRGAKFAYFVDSAKTSLDTVNENLKTVGLASSAKTYNMNGADFLKSTSNTFDIAFLDPPYSKGLIEEVLPLLSEKMSDRGIIICEHPIGEELPQTAGKLNARKEYKYGKIGVTVYSVKGE